MNSASPHDVRYPANFLAVASAADEDRLLRLCASAVLERRLDADCYFNRYRAHGARGVSLHFRGTHNMQELLRAVSAAAAADARPFAADFLPIVLDPKAALGDVFGGVDSLAVYAAFSFDSAPLLWRWSAQGMAAPALRLPAAAEVLVHYMYLTRSRFDHKSHNAYPGLFVSFRSHYEGFAASLDDPGAALRAFGQRYAAVNPLLATLAARHEHHPGAPWLAEWQQLIERAFDDILERVRRHTLVTGMTADYSSGGKNLLASSFHEKIVSTKEYTEHAMKEPVFQANRILLGLVYLSLFRLGLPLIERYFLCYAISRFIEERHGVSAEQAFDRSVARTGRRRRWSWLFKHLSSQQGAPR